MTRRGRFTRLHVTYRGVLGVEVGIFVAVDHLRRADRLSTVDEQRYFDIDDWFRAELPNPPFYADGNTVGAITWFKTGIVLTPDHIWTSGAIVDRATLDVKLDNGGFGFSITRGPDGSIWGTGAVPGSGVNDGVALRWTPGDYKN